VHAFEKDPLSFWLFLSMMVLSLAAGLGGLLWRRKSFQSPSDFESLLSKDASYYFNNVLMLVAGVLVAYWTIAPSLPGWLPGGGQTYNAGSYNAVARPIGILYVFIMAVCPILSWAKTDAKTFWDRLKWPLVGTAVLGGVLLFEWWTNLRPFLMKDAGGAAGQVMAVVGLIVASLAIVLPIYLFIDGARKRSSNGKESFGSALLKIFTKARTTSGGYVTHMGIGVILVGLIGSTMFVSDYPVSIAQKAGAQATAGPYVFTFQKLVESTRPNKDLVRQATFVVTQNGKQVAVISPTQVLPYTVLVSLQGQKSWEQGRREVSIIGSPIQDVFSIFNGTLDPTKADSDIVLDVKINPLIVWVWVGFLLTILGTTLAAWPKKERQLVAARSGAKGPSKR
jgi:cytochrome c-type biogenesis protein CcmF